MGSFNYIYVLIVVISYLIGAIPWAFIIGKFKGVDIRNHGSGNVGATNVRRVLGKKFGILCFFLDFLKGFIPAFVILNMDKYVEIDISTDLAFIFVAFAVVAGHMWPVYLKFKGGKGVSTMAGLLLALAPLSLLVGGAVWAIFFYSFRYVSLASICASLTLPVSAYFLSKYEVYKLSDTLQWILIILAALVIFRHKGNIIRLMTGTESRFTKK